MAERNTKKPATRAKTLTIERVFNASPESLWEFWMDPKKFARWFNPATGMDLVIHEFDPRPGGRARFDMPQPDGNPNPQEGVFHSLTPYREIVTGAPDKSFLIKVHFEPMGAKQTRMTVEVTGVPPEYHAGATKGWNQGFDKLAKLLEAGPTPGRTTARKVTIERTFKAPPQKVWAMWTTKEGLEQWYAPEGFDVRVRKVDVRVGGGYEIVMEATDPDVIGAVKAAGVATTNVLRGTYTEIAPERRLAFRDVADFIPGVAPYEVATSVEFHAVPGGTKVVLVTDAMHNAEWTQMATMGWNSQLDRLVAILDAEGLGGLTTPSKTRTRAEGSAQGRDLVITRNFDAPRELVWKAWTDPERMKRWWGPKGFTAPFAKIDLRVGGAYLYCMRSPEGKDYWGTGVFREIVPMERIVITDSFADEEGNVVPATHYGMSPDFPLEMLVTVTFEDHGGKTKLTLRHAGLPAGPDQEGAKAGWSQSLDKLADDLAMRTSGTEFVVDRGKRQIVMSSLFDAPRERVFQAYTDPKLIPQWWGPRLYTTTVERMEVRKGGQWRFVSRDPDGTEYAFHGEYKEVVPPERLVSTFEFEGMPGHVVLNTATFEERGGKTTLTITSRFETVEDLQGMLQSGMESGARESHDRLEELLARI